MMTGALPTVAPTGIGSVTIFASGAETGTGSTSAAVFHLSF
jgi:hypothetical protein